MRAKRPVLYVGGGAISADACDGAPRARRADPHPGHARRSWAWALSRRTTRCRSDMLGMHGDVLRQHGRAQIRLPDRGRRPLRRPRHRQPRPFAPQAKIIHIDIDPSSISKNIKVDVPIVGDARRVLAQLVEAVRRRRPLAGRPVREARRPVARARSPSGSTSSPFRYDWNDDVIKPQYVDRGDLQAHQGRGDHRRPAWASTRCGPPSTTASSHPRTWFTSGGLGTMGYGLPAAMGAQVGQPGQAPSSTSTATAPS